MTNSRSRFLFSLLAVALFAAFVAGIAHLFSLRFRAGDIYPPYSTLRADPLGTKAFYDGLAGLPHVEVSRHFRAVRKLGSGTPLTFFYPGIPISAAWEETEINEFEDLLANGSRVVATFVPTTKKPDRSSATEERRKKEKEDAKKKSEDDEEPSAVILSMEELGTRWDFTFGYTALKDKTLPQLHAVRRAGATEETIPWRTLAFFDRLKPVWSVLYECEGKPVIIERSYGDGSLVLCSDSYFLSNEALRRHRAPLLLGALAGGNARIVFDELHHGVRDQPSVMMLARRYQLGAFLAALIALAILFVWKNAAPLVPHRLDAAENDDVLLGKESSAGFVNLLRRNIPPAQLLALCWREWRAAFAHQPSRATKTQLAQAEAILSDEQNARGKNALRAYRELHALLNKRKT